MNIVKHTAINKQNIDMKQGTKSLCSLIETSVVLLITHDDDGIIIKVTNKKTHIYARSNTTLLTYIHSIKSFDSIYIFIKKKCIIFISFIVRIICICDRRSNIIKEALKFFCISYYNYKEPTL